mgnify:CR=1 FL=1
MVKECFQGKSSEDKIGLIIELLHKEFTTSILPRLRTEIDETKRYLSFIAWLNKKFEELHIGKIIITGGFAVEIYTGRAYRTMDVDIVVDGSLATKVIEGFLSKFSEKIGRGYLPKYELLDVKSIDIVSNSYTRKAKPIKIIIDDYYAYLEPPEELIVTYLSGWKFWKSTEDRDKAMWLYIVWRDRLDEEYLIQRVVEEKVMDKLNELRRLTEKLR